MDTTVENLNGYSFEVSVEQSGVNLAAHRVQLLKLRGVRARLANGQIISAQLDRVVYQHE